MKLNSRTQAMSPSRSARLVGSLPLAALFVACAGQPAAHQETTVDVLLAGHVMLVSPDRRYISLTSVKVIAPVTQRIEPPGTLWISGHQSFTKRLISLEQVAALEPERWSGNVATKVKTLDGSSAALSDQYLLWCPSNETLESSNRHCLKVISLSGDVGGTQTHGPLALIAPLGFNGILERQFTVYSGSSADQQRAQFAAWQSTSELDARQRDADRIAEAKLQEDKHETLLQHLRVASTGTRDFCTSRSLLPRSQPIGNALIVNCGVYGQVSIGQLRDAHWDVQVTNRIPTQNAGDSIELTVTKER